MRRPHDLAGVTIMAGADSRCQLLQGNCLELLRGIPDGSIDMVLCDLPYGVTRNRWDSAIPLVPLWAQYRRITKPNGAVVLHCNGMFTARLLASNPREWRYNLVWDKQKGCDYLNAGRKPLQSHEDIAVFYRAQPTYNKQAWYSTPYRPVKSGTMTPSYGRRMATYAASPDGARCPLTVLSFARDSNKLHPTQKPVALLEWLIKTYTNEGETVLDNCMGSGSTGVACLNTGRRFIGMEQDIHYFDVAVARMAEAERALEEGGKGK